MGYLAHDLLEELVDLGVVERPHLLGGSSGTVDEVVHALVEGLDGLTALLVLPAPLLDDLAVNGGLDRKLRLEERPVLKEQ